MYRTEISSVLKALTQADGPSGRESAVAGLIANAIAPFCTSVRYDALGNLLAYRKGGPNPPGLIMIAAHMDEIGLVVTRVEDGFLHVGPIGGVVALSCVGQEVTIHPSGRGAEAFPDGLHGYIGERPPHLRGNRDDGAPTGLGELRVDTGLPADLLADGLIRVGDVALIRGEYLELMAGRIASKALDNRASVTAMIAAMGYLSSTRHDWDVLAVATVQEEVGLRGAMTSAFGAAPDLAVAIDVTFAATPGLDESRTVEMDKGPAIGWGPNLHPAMHRRITAVADDLEIPYVTEAVPGASGTDAWAIQVAREGIPTALLSIPIRYMHSSTELLAVADVDRTARLAASFISRLDGDSLRNLADEVA